MRLDPGGVGSYEGKRVIRYPRLAKHDHRPYPRHLVCECGGVNVSINVVPVERKRHIRFARRLRVQAVCAKCGKIETIRRSGLRLTTER